MQEQTKLRAGCMPAAVFTSLLLRQRLLRLMPATMLLAACHFQVASSPADVARQSDITFAMLSDPPAAVQVATGPGGIVEGEQQ
jgi:3-hydroxyisobutyrate dehydrogenase-like beta-hydroxyacid dehydrogenase